MQDQICNIKIMEKKRREHPRVAGHQTNTCVTEIPKEDKSEIEEYLEK